MVYLRNIVCVHIGQAGVQISSACWELFCVEHNIGCDGKKVESDGDLNDNTFHSFFRQGMDGQYIPRALLIDLEPSVIDEIRTGKYGRLFHPDLIVSCMQDAANNYARGRLALGRFILPLLLEKIRIICETVDSVQGFFLFNSFGGGTGSGIGSLLLEILATDYAKRSKFNLAVYPGTKMSTAVVEPYNSMMFMHDTITDCDVSALFSNECMYEVCSRNLDIENPTYASINRIVGQLVSSITSPLRFDTLLGKTLEEMTGTNLIPYPRLHFPIMSYAPILNSCRSEHAELTTSELTRMAFHYENCLLNCNLDRGKYMTCCLLYRGQFSPREINNSINEIKELRTVKWVDWCPTGFKIGICQQAPSTIERSGIGNIKRSVMMMTNHSSVIQSFSRLFTKFDVLYEKRAFVHWYVSEGMEESEFVEARDDMATLERDYKEAVLSTKNNQPPVELKKVSSVTKPVSVHKSSLKFVPEIENTFDAAEAENGAESVPFHSEESHETEEQPGDEIHVIESYESGTTDQNEEGSRMSALHENYGLPLEIEDDQPRASVVVVEPEAAEEEFTRSSVVTAEEPTVVTEETIEETAEVGEVDPGENASGDEQFVDEVEMEEEYTETENTDETGEVIADENIHNIYKSKRQNNNWNNSNSLYQMLQPYQNSNNNRMQCSLSISTCSNGSIIQETLISHDVSYFRTQFLPCQSSRLPMVMDKATILFKYFNTTRQKPRNPITSILSNIFRHIKAIFAGKH